MGGRGPRSRVRDSRKTPRPCHATILTYMSIQVKIAALVASDRLRAWHPAKGRPAKRRLYLTRQAWTDLMDANSAVNLLGCRGYIESSLMRWTTGGLVYGDTKGRFLFRLDPPPPEVWEMRVTEPVVQARLFGRFAEADTLILTGMFTRRLLGKKGSPEWREAMVQTTTSWDGLFGLAPLFTGTTIHDYVKENCDDFPI